ncbi:MULTISPECIES: hypothetical protein [Mycolicibacter]|uniref:Transcriptional regulator n=2 Tax=Mycolicibacter TaxID=1073531 RepID=A0ABU5XNB5_9MYCO|nr:MULTISPECIES: hypothetical protein [unclassified Mycolicibacter]MEB3023474.1 hypothetical protein [Mycolicibacter sp. MYC098]MEB3035105.1 hypothetical protein [Mycolicibacter sp. MYC340]
MASTPVANPLQQQAIDSLLDKSARKSRRVGIRNTFVQGGTQKRPEFGPLHKMVRAGDAHALDVFLLHRTLVSAEPWTSSPLDAVVWARMLGAESDKDHGAALVSRIWRRLDEKYGLVSRAKVGRQAVYTSLREDGSGEPYTAPTGRDGDLYFGLPFEYWTDEQAWYRTLTLPAKAMLLVSSTLKPGFILPSERVPEWYGISESTAQRGLQELREVGLLNRATSYKPTPLQKIPMTEVHHYTLVAPFGRTTRARHLSLVVDNATTA